MNERDEVIASTYRRHCKIDIERDRKHDKLTVLNIGAEHCLWEEEGRWHVGHRWRVQDRDTGGWDAGFDLVPEDEGGGSFESFESALRTALSLEFDARLRDAWSEVGDLREGG